MKTSKKDPSTRNLRLDDRLRQNVKSYKSFAKALLDRRISGWAGAHAIKELEHHFRADVSAPERLDVESSREGSDSNDRPVDKLRGKLCDIVNPLEIEAIIRCLSCQSSTIVEKAALYAFYQVYSKGSTDLPADAMRIDQMKSTALSNRKNHLYNLIKHFGDDFRAQLNRSFRQRTSVPLTLDSIILMSEGLPRVFLTIMKHIFSWSEFELGQLSTREISLFARRRGVLDAARWFQHDMPQVGAEGTALVTSITRLAELFRVNRYSDKPTECSLIAFSIPVEGISEVARSRLRDSEHRSFLVRVPSGERDRNSKQLRQKFQLNRLLCAFFDLPIARRGTARFDADDIDAIFGSDDGERFRALRKHWSRRRNWPFGRRWIKHDQTIDDSQVQFDWG